MRSLARAHREWTDYFPVAANVEHPRRDRFRDNEFLLLRRVGEGQEHVAQAEETRTFHYQFQFSVYPFLKNPLICIKARGCWHCSCVTACYRQPTYRARRSLPLHNRFNTTI